MATESLNIKVTDNGSSRQVAKEFSNMAKEILRAGSDLAKMKKQMRGFSGGFNSEVGKVNKQLNKLGTNTRKASRGIRRVGVSATKTKGALQGLAASMSSLRGVMFSLGGVLAVQQFLGMSDQYQNMENRIKLVTSSASELATVQTRLEGIAKNTRQSLTATVETYVRMRKATKDAGVEGERLFGVMTTLNKMLAISGASSQEAEQSIRQLSQAFSKGFLNGDEFRTVSEAMPDILDALQRSLGVTRGELRKMSESGQLTTKVLIEAFEASKDLVDKQFANSVKTFGQAWQLLKDEILKTIGALNKSTGLIGLVIGGMALLADNLWLVVVALKALTLWMGVKLIKALIASSTVIKTTFVQNLLLARFHMAGFQAQSASAVLGLNRFALGAAAAGVAGWALGKVLDDVFDISDRLAGIDAHDKSTSLLQDAKLHVSEYRKELKKLEEGLKGEFKTKGDFLGGKLLFDKDKATGRIADIKKEIAAHQNNIKHIEDEAAAKAKAEDQIIQSKAFSKLENSLLPAAAAAAELDKKYALITKTMLDGNITWVEASHLARELASVFSQTHPAIDQYISNLEEENKVLGLSKEAQSQHNAEVKAAISLRELYGAAAPLAGSEEFAKVVNLLKEKEKLENKSKGRGSRKKDTTAKDLAALVASMNPIIAATQKLEKAQLLLNKAYSKGIPITREMDMALRAMEATTEAARRPTWTLVQATQDLLNTQQLSTQQLEQLNHERSVEADLLAANGGVLDDYAKATLANFFVVERMVNKNRELRESLKDIKKEQFEVIADPRQGFSDAARVAAASGAERERLMVTNEMKAAIQDLNAEQADGNILLSDYNVLVKAERDLAAQKIQAINDSHSAFGKIKELLTDQAIEDLWISSVTNAFLGLEEVAITTITSIETAMFDMLTGQASSWDDVGSAIKETFHGVAEAMLADITRILIRMALIQAVSAFSGGGAGALVGNGLLAPTFRHGGKVDTTSLPHFAHGGGFQVGGAGGPDTKLVQFMASPGENVSVTNPGQSRLDNNKQPQQTQAGVTIVNSTKPADMVAAMNSGEGVRTILNVIQLNSPAVKAALR